ncbi:MAG TPA: prepilin-type N-terminal cleavage/methylation domain-containing protein [Candidatus Dojkabacteria bacterium]|nr:prepilin-type N-terminal cleavage/methylation domain-containing protein [Candidatus Dojkabacteria bacterium]
MLNFRKKLIKKIKGYSLVEVLVTLTIFAILTVMLMNTIFLNIRISRTISNRTRMRSDLNELTSLIERDIRNASNIEECQSDYLVNLIPVPYCKMSIPNSALGNSIFDWSYNCFGTNQGGSEYFDHSVCKRDATGKTVYFSSKILQIDSVSFEKIVDNLVETNKVTIIVTIVASARNTSWNINNQVRQIIISTRNYRVNLVN